MKVMHVSYCYYPDPIGGTEAYVNELSGSLKEFGIESIVAAPSGSGDNTYFHEGVKVRRFGISGEVPDPAELYGGSDPVAAKAFGTILDEEKADIVHTHALTYAVSLNLMLEAKKRSIPVVFSYHTPAVSCQSGSLLTPEGKICNGSLDTHLCSMCVLRGHGATKLMSHILVLVPDFPADLIRQYGLSGKLFTAIRMRNLVQRRIALLRRFFEEVDCFVALCDWSRNLLLGNGLRPDKITLIRHGISRTCGDEVSGTDGNIPENASVLKLAYFGRADRLKGLGVVIGALKALPRRAISLDIYGIAQDEKGRSYLGKMKKLAAKDKRIMFMPSLPGREVAAVLKKYHYLVIPSLCMETGPLVALQALEAGTPVVGSDIGGVREIIRDGFNGILVEPGSLKKWQAALERILQDRELLSRLRSGIKPPRVMHDVAEETARLYEDLIHSPKKRSENPWEEKSAYYISNTQIQPVIRR